jgi:hypothetical protein
MTPPSFAIFSMWIGFPTQLPLLLIAIQVIRCGHVGGETRGLVAIGATRIVPILLGSLESERTSRENLCDRYG